MSFLSTNFRLLYILFLCDYTSLWWQLLIEYTK